MTLKLIFRLVRIFGQEDIFGQKDIFGQQDIVTKTSLRKTNNNLLKCKTT